MLDDVSLTVKSGEWLTIIGPNGSGKSTLINALDGLVNVDDGTIKVNGLILNDSNLFKIRKKIGIVFQNPDNQFVGGTVEDDIAFGLENSCVPQPKMQHNINMALNNVGMSGTNNRIPEELSGGQKQRIALAGILALEPQIIILDEATSMLDPLGRKKILDLVYQLNKDKNITVISITHDASELRYSDRVLIMDNGKIINEQNKETLFNDFKELNALGLSIPYSERIRLKLAKNGISVPDHYLNNEELINWIMQLPFKK